MEEVEPSKTTINPLIKLFLDFQKEAFDKIRIVKKDPICPHCHAKMVKNGGYDFNYNKNIPTTISGYKCSNKQHTHYVYAIEKIENNGGFKYYNSRLFFNKLHLHFVIFRLFEILHMPDTRILI